MMIRNLCCHSDVDTAITCLRSLASNLQGGCQFTIHDDGSLTESDVSNLHRQLPNSTVIRRSDADARLNDTILRRHPHLRQARNRVVYLLKVVDVVMLNDDEVVRFVDSDVLFFRRFMDAFSRQNGYDACFMLDMRSFYGFRAKNYWPLGPVNPVRRLNCGMFWIRRECIDFEWLEWVCSHCSSDQIAITTFEQGLWAALAARCNCRMFDPQQICTAEDLSAIPANPVALHFNGPSKKLFHHYARQQESTIDGVEKIQTIPSRTYSLLEYGAGAIKFRLRRAFK